MKLISPNAWEPQGIDFLEDRAVEALRETDQSVSVTAGAGAGKTEFLAQKAAYLLQTGLCPDPKRILAISFKRDAAQNLAERVKKRCPDEGRRFVSLTFDAFTKSIIDQFREAIPGRYRPPADYDISFPTKDTWNDFFQRLGIHDINTGSIERLVANTKLPIKTASISPRQKQILAAYWLDQLEGSAGANLTFAMINRLVERMLRENEQIRRALLATYPVAFLDEFQDTTTAQFQVVQAAFENTQTKLTAVGDDKQRIMGWAGAMPDAFATFSATFAARPITLVSNWRSHEDLVSIQHLIASRIDPAVEAVVAKRPRHVDGEVAAIWQFRTADEEVSFLADWIAEQVSSGQVEPHDIAVLVRNFADRIEKDLAPSLQAKGIPLRNVARAVGGVAIQDLLAEDLTKILLPFLRLGAKRRDAEAWTSAQAQMQFLDATIDEDEVSLQRLNRRTERLSREMRVYMGSNQPTKGAAAGLVSTIIEEVGENAIRQHNPSYRRDADFKRVRIGFTALLEEALLGGGSWSEVLDRFEGVGQVPLMTVHKSKGLEFHTIIFFGLDNKSWWSLTPDKTEELSSFFVAFTRAEQRAFFTCCSEKGGRIAWLENLLGDAVPRISMSEAG